MRDNLKRVNVVLTKELIQLADKLKKKYHNSRSQVVRQGILLVAEEQSEGSGRNSEINLRPIFEWMEETDERVERMEKELKELKKGVKFLVRKEGSAIEKLADDIEELLLERDEALSVPDIADYFPSYGESEVLQGLEKLVDEFVVKRLKQENGPTKWKIRGG